MKIVFIADIFLPDMTVPGGGELNNHEAINLLRSQGHEVKFIRSLELLHGDPSFFRTHKECKYIIGNFLGLSENLKTKLQTNCEYIIYEHDHKYLTSRDPSSFENYAADEASIINRDFYNHAQAILCQSKLHAEVVKKNLPDAKVINLGGNLWTTQDLELMEKLASVPKNRVTAVLDSSNPIKNTIMGEEYCNRKKIEYDLVGNLGYHEFLEKLSTYDTLVFFPQVLETLNRLVVEARMMNLKVVTTSKTGATSEPWFKLRGSPLIRAMRDKRTFITNTIVRALGDE